MSKALDVVLAGIIAGIVAYATSVLGIGGTIIGAVIGAILYQIMTHLFKAPLEGIQTQSVEARIVYTIPLILIIVIEVLFIFALMYLKPGNFFYILENATDYNLFRSIGIGLIIMGIYPIIQPENIKKQYGFIIISIGVVKLLGGFADFKVPITDFYAFIFSELGVIISLLVIAGLTYVTFSLIKESVNIIREKGEINSEREVKFGEKIDHWYSENQEKNSQEEEKDSKSDRLRRFRWFK